MDILLSYITETAYSVTEGIIPFTNLLTQNPHCECGLTDAGGPVTHLVVVIIIYLIIKHIAYGKKPLMSTVVSLGFENTVWTVCWEQYQERNKSFAICFHFADHGPATALNGRRVSFYMCWNICAAEPSAEFQHTQFVFKLNRICCIAYAVLFTSSNAAPPWLPQKERNGWGVKLGITWSAMYSSLLSADPFLMGFPVPCVPCLWVPSCAVNAFGHRPLQRELSLPSTSHSHICFRLRASMCSVSTETTQMHL